MWLPLGLALSLLALTTSCDSGRSGDDAAGEPRSLEVSASAYNSVASQTNEQPNLAAWGDELKPGMKVIAVSEDLIDLGLDYGTVVTIEGLPGRYTVLDRTSSRIAGRIDIYMGTDVEAAREWGVRQVTITWNSEE
jgi:3D (Asp-Asp-Asp) domain-containing protein